MHLVGIGLLVSVSGLLVSDNDTLEKTLQKKFELTPNPVFIDIPDSDLVKIGAGNSLGNSTRKIKLFGASIGRNYENISGVVALLLPKNYREDSRYSHHDAFWSWLKSSYEGQGEVAPKQISFYDLDALGQQAVIASVKQSSLPDWYSHFENGGNYSIAIGMALSVTKRSEDGKRSSHIVDDPRVTAQRDPMVGIMPATGANDILAKYDGGKEGLIDFGEGKIVPVKELASIAFDYSRKVIRFDERLRSRLVFVKGGFAPEYLVRSLVAYGETQPTAVETMDLDSRRRERWDLLEEEFQAFAKELSAVLGCSEEDLDIFKNDKYVELDADLIISKYPKLAKELDVRQGDSIRMKLCMSFSIKGDGFYRSSNGVNYGNSATFVIDP